MSRLILNHPALVLNQDIQAICHPLKALQIDYFCHVLVTPQKQFSAIGTSPGFTEHYLKKRYYNVDLRMANHNNLNKFVLWDTIERHGLTAKMHHEAAHFGIKHTFTIIEHDEQGRNCYHFAHSGNSLAINQTYLSNLDLLQAFIPYFKEKINGAKELANAHQIKFEIDSNAKGYQTISDLRSMSHEERDAYLKLITPASTSPIKNLTLTNKISRQPVQLSPQQTKCVLLLAQGQSNKQIAKALELSPRTIENYLLQARWILNCDSSKELLTLYYNQLQKEKAAPCNNSLF